MSTIHTLIITGHNPTLADVLQQAATKVAAMDELTAAQRDAAVAELNAARAALKPSELNTPVGQAAAEPKSTVYTISLMAEATVTGKATVMATSREEAEGKALKLAEKPYGITWSFDGLPSSARIAR